MALTIWTERSGYTFGTIQERSIVNLPLPVTYDNLFNDSTNVTFNVIAGQLPPGLRIVEDSIVGTPFEVPRLTEFKFVIRATYDGQLADRTFLITIDGADQPAWQTPSGSLSVGPNDVYYILDNSYIDFQLTALDNDTATGQQLKYFIASKDGELPPGLILTDAGRIVGWVQPALAIPETSGNGYFDTTTYDDVAFDFGYRSTNGYDSYVYDTVFFDYSAPSLSPKKLNRNYEFVFTVTDGDTTPSSSVAYDIENEIFTTSYISKRKFKIYVVGDDFFRADNVITQAGSNTFMADISYVRAPIWITPTNLGTRRANNYQTLKLDIYDKLDLGPVVYSLDTTNPDSTPSILPPGLQFDQGTAEVFGVVPYQPAITKSYKFTVTATRLSDRYETASSKRTFNVNILGEVESVMSWNSASDLGAIEANLISTLSVNAESTVTDSVILYVKTSGDLPPGLTLNLDGEIVGKVPQFGSGTIYCGTWVSNRNYLLNDVVKYSGVYYKAITSGSGVLFNIAQWDSYTFTNPGIITIEQGDFTLDFGTTTLDRDYNFTVEARDILGYSAISRTFNISITTPNDRLYSNLTVRPYLKQSQRAVFKTFITNSEVFDSAAIYRPNDPNFGVQPNLKMLIYAGIETKTAAEVVSAVGRNHKQKRFKLGDVKRAVAKVPGTNDIVYEVIYIDVIDPLEIGDKTLDFIVQTEVDPFAATIDQTSIYYNGPFNTSERFWGPGFPYPVTADRSDVYPDPTLKQPASVALWRKRIKQIGLTERNYLPLWMRTIQDGSVQELGFVKAIPLCFCKPGRSTDILLNIKNNNFDFKQLDYVIDRYTIDSVTGYSADKYIVFRNDRTIIT